RHAIENDEKQQRTNAAVGHATGERLHVSDKLAEAERALWVEKAKADRQRNSADQRGDAIERSIHDGEGKTQSTLAPSQVVLIDARPFSQAEQDRAIGVSNADANDRGTCEDRHEQSRVIDPREHGEDVREVVERALEGERNAGFESRLRKADESP